MIIMSPSNILAHMKCPLQAWAMREKRILWKESPQKQRGTEAHAALEQAAKKNFEAPILPSGCNIEYVADLMHKLRLLVNEHGLEVYTEQDLALTKAFKPTTFFADDVFFRCRADLLLLAPKRNYAYVGDWKTGKVYDYSKNQMRLEALLVSCMYNIRVVHWALYYLDAGKTVTGHIDLTQGFGPVTDLLDIMKEMQILSKSNGPWVAKKNAFCKWCDWYHKDCKESMAW